MAWKASDQLSIGAGLRFQYMDVKLTNALDFGTAAFGLGVPGALPGSLDGFSELEGNGIGWGLNAGLIWEPIKGTRLGLNYQSQIEHSLRGSADFQSVPSFLAASSSFADDKISASFTSPDTATISLYQEINDQWTVMADAAWTRWSVFEELRIEYDNGRPDSVTPENWKDTWFLSLGTRYQPNENWTFNFGVAYDKSPIKDAFRTARIPGEDRTWVALGAAYQVNDWLDVAASYTHIFVNDPSLTMTTLSAVQTGNVTGSYDSQIDILAVKLTAKF